MGQLRGHNDTPFGRKTAGRPIGRPVVGRPQGIFCGFSYYQLVILLYNIVHLIMEFTLTSSCCHSLTASAKMLQFLEL
jgi:hypothetical protein